MKDSEIAALQASRDELLEACMRQLAFELAVPLCDECDEQEMVCEVHETERLAILALMEAAIAKAENQGETP